MTSDISSPTGPTLPNPPYTFPVDQTSYDAYKSLFSVYKMVYTANYALALTRAQELAADPQNPTKQQAFQEIYNKLYTSTATPEDPTDYVPNYATVCADLFAKATEYATASARAEIFTTSTNQTKTTDIIAELSGGITPQSIAITNLDDTSGSLQTGGITAALLKELQDNLQGANFAPSLATAGEGLQNAFNAYRYASWRIGNAQAGTPEIGQPTPSGQNRLLSQLIYEQTRLLATAHPDNETYQTMAAEQYTILFAWDNFINALKTEQTTARTTLENAFTNYKNIYAQLALPSSLAPTTTLETIVQSVQTFHDAWNIHISNATQAATTAADTAKQAQIDTNAALQESHYLEHPSTLPSDITSSLLALSHQTLVNVGFDLTQIKIPSPSRVPSIKELFDALGKLQVAIKQLETAIQAETSQWWNISRTIGATGLSGFLSAQLAFSDWAQDINEADKAFNANVDTYNNTSLSLLVEEYEKYRSHVVDLNKVLIDNNTLLSRQRELILQANILSAQFSQAINAASQDYTVAQNTMDFFGTSQLTPLSPIQTPTSSLDQTLKNLALFTTVEPAVGDTTLLYLPPAPTLSTQTPPITQESLNSLNASIEQILKNIAPFQNQIMDTLKNTDPSIGNLQPFILQSHVEVRSLIGNISNLTSILSSTFFVLLCRISNASQDASQATHEDALKIILGMFASLTQSSSTTPQTSSTTGPGLASTTTIDSSKKPSVIQLLLARIFASEIFITALTQQMEQASIFSGLSQAGYQPQDIAKLLFTLTSSGTITEEQKALLQTLMEKNSLEGVFNALIQNLISLSSNKSILSTIALQALYAVGKPEEKLSPEDLQELINMLVALEELFFLLMAALLGVSMGAISPEELFDRQSFKKLITILEHMGVLPEASDKIANKIAPEFATVFPGLLEAGLSSEQAIATLILLSIPTLGLSIFNTGVTGNAYPYSLLTLLKEARIIPQNQELIPQELYQTIRTFLEQHLPSVSRKERIIQSFDKLFTPSPPSVPFQPKASFTPKVPFTPAAPVASRTSFTPEVPVTPFIETPPLNILQQTFNQKQDSSTTFSAAIARMDQHSPILAPSTLVQPLLDDYRNIPPEIRVEIEISLPPELIKAFSGIDKETIAALIVKAHLWELTQAQIQLLLNMLHVEKVDGLLAAFQRQTAIIHRLFTPTEEETRLREENLRKTFLLSSIFQGVYRPSTVPKSTRLLLRERLENTSRTLAQIAHADKVSENIVKTLGLDTLSSYTKKFLETLIGPAKLLVREFSIFTRTGADKNPIVFPS